MELTDTIEKIIGEEGAPGNPAVLAQIEIPEVEPPKNNQEAAPGPKKKSNYKGRPKGAKNKKKDAPKRNVEAESKEWREVAMKEPAAPEPPPVVEPPVKIESLEEDEGDPISEMSSMSSSAIRETKADSYVNVIETAVHMVGSMFDAPEKKLVFKVRERKALRDAILPLIPEDTGEDPWGQFVMIGFLLLAPRAAVIYEAREAQLAASEAAAMAEQQAQETAECLAVA